MRSSVPSPATSFLGREAELAAGEELLASTRVLTVTGPGGAGKTRYALELARRLAPSFADGAVACFFAPLRDAGLVLPTIAQALSVREEPGSSALEALVARLEGAELLLLLDNLEHVLEATSELVELCAACPRLRLLATSREQLRVDGELVYELPLLSDDDGVALFCERARSEPSEPIRELCRRLEGLPLAIELAAARLRLLSSEQLLERLGSRLELLTGSRDADPRQQTLEATIEWSYDLLSAEEQRVFRALSVFAGGCTLEAAKEVAGAEPDTIESLLEKSLLRRSAGRISMLETIREFAELRLGDERDRLHAAHALYYFALASRSDVGLEHMDADVRRAIEDEADNFRLAFQVGIAVDPLRALDAARALDRYWQLGGRDREGYDTLRRTLDAAPHASLLDHGRALVAAASLAIRLGMLPDAARLLDEAVDELRRLGDPKRLAGALNNRGLVALLSRDLPTARLCLEESLALKREIGDEAEIAPAASNLGKLAIFEGDLPRARSLLDEALELRVRIRTGRLYQTLFDVALVEIMSGDPIRATQVAGDGLADAAREGDPVGEIEAGALLGVCSVLAGELERARDALADALERAVDEGYDDRLPFVFWAASGYVAASGHAEDALLLLGAGGDAGAAEGGDPFAALWSAHVLAAAALPDERAAEILERGRALPSRAVVERATRQLRGA